MAIVRFGSTVIGIRGTIGGTTFTAGSAGAYAKSYRCPKTQSSIISSQVKNSIIPLGALWSTCSPALQSAWNAYGQAPPELDYNSLGIQYWLTGFQWFVRINRRRLSMGFAFSTSVPGSSAVTAPASCALTAVHGSPCTIAISWPSGSFPSGFYPFLFFSVYPSTGLSSPPGGFKLIYSPIERPDTGLDISSYVSARFGNVPQSWSVFAKLHIIRYDAVLSIPALANVAVS